VIAVSKHCEVAGDVATVDFRQGGGAAEVQ
jgi:hypothetical protein